MASSVSRELGSLANTVADTENGSTMSAQRTDKGRSNPRREGKNTEAEFPAKQRETLKGQVLHGLR
jgi:hypothetical protein